MHPDYRAAINNIYSSEAVAKGLFVLKEDLVESAKIFVKFYSAQLHSELAPPIPDLLNILRSLSNLRAVRDPELDRQITTLLSEGVAP